MDEKPFITESESDDGPFWLIAYPRRGDTIELQYQGDETAASVVPMPLSVEQVRELADFLTTEAYRR